jgi:uncharacterized protein (DUF1501 family)
MTHSRRDFLKSMVGASSFLSLAPTFPLFLQRAASAAGTDPAGGQNVLVVLQLSGGNDGLNTVVPYADDAYQRSRKTLRLTESQVIRIDSYLGFHPELKGFHQLLQDGKLAVVQGVGYPHSNRDHDVAMRQWHTARPDEPLCPTGWIGRAVDLNAAPGQADVPAVFVGPIAPPFALNAEASVIPVVRNARQLTRTPLPGGKAASGADAQAVPPPRAPAQDAPLLAALTDAAQTARAMSQRVEAVLATDTPTASYPSYTLAEHLQIVAQLIRAELGIRVFFVELGGGGIGGFDNHANQRDNHAAVLREMSASIAAFLGDLQRESLASRVLLMTFSEFGRTLTENGRRGTDHGAAAPVFLAGGRVQGGLHGKHPSLTDLDQDALKFHTDYRALYATVLERWLGCDARAVLGESFGTLDVV